MLDGRLKTGVLARRNGRPAPQLASSAPISPGGPTSKNVKNSILKPFPVPTRPGRRTVEVLLADVVLAHNGLERRLLSLNGAHRGVHVVLQGVAAGRRGPAQVGAPLRRARGGQPAVGQRTSRDPRGQRAPTLATIQGGPQGETAAGAQRRPTQRTCSACWRTLASSRRRSFSSSCMHQLRPRL